MSTKSYQKRHDIYHSLSGGDPVRRSVSPSEVLAWSRQFETGMPEIDQQHRRLVQFINEIGCLLQDDMETASFVKSLLRIFDELARYVDYHFRFEEKLMRRCEEEHHAAHKLAYADFVQQISLAVSKVCDDPAKVAGRMLAFLLRWLMTHILAADMPPARPAAESGATERPDFGMALFDAMSGLYENLADRSHALPEREYDLGADVTRRLELQPEGMTDMQTGLCSRRHFFELAEQELAHSKRYGKRLSVLMMDLDEFKPVDETCGHRAGDDVLRMAGDVCRKTLREVDIAAHIGGDEFAILLPESDAAQAMEVAERLRSRMKPGLSLSASVGIATLNDADATVERLLDLAGKALYRARSSGRNSVAE